MTISTAGMIESVRDAAKMTKTQEEQDCLNSIANRIEILTAANAGMDLQLNSIRAALNIPINTSVQAGVIAETTRLNEEVLSLRSQLSESVSLANKLRRTAKEHQEENQFLRTELAELQERPADAEIQCMEDMSLRVINVRDGFSLGRHPVFLRPAPQTAILPYAYAYQYAGCETCEGFQDWRSKLSKERPADWMLETGKVTDLIELYAVKPLSVVPDEMRETLYRIANHIAGAKDGMPAEWQDWAEEIETDIRRAAMIAAAQQLERKDGDA
ncbi:hypothetical protein WCT84_06740 [Pectobacterium brasiliense]|uniref:Uncharacterized protein n=1 Tax=Pectobacterium polonicum TaxID=2485124 RepID=A0ABV1P9I0_9GAMM